jgi:thiosulfate/3-mercaptopyruvate sulfurtransferase
VVLDARADAAAYARGHLPWAAHVPVAAVRSARGGRTDLRPAPELRRVFGAAGVGGDSEVVVYADERLFDATQVVLALATLGHRRAAVLEGGLRAWVAEGSALATEVPRPSDGSYPERPAPDLGVGAREVSKASRTGRPVVLDVRPAATARSGHVPGALNRPSSEDTVEGADGVFWRSRAELLAGYAAAGVPATGDVVVCCGTGLHATQTWFTLTVLLGRTRVRWYDGSFEDWAQRRELPVETGAVQAAAR